MPDEMGLLRKKNRELKRTVATARDAARMAQIEKERQGSKKLDVQIQFRTLATPRAILAKNVDNNTDYTEFVD